MLPVLRGVSYDDYVRLRDHPRNRRVRMTYRDGALEIRPPTFRHERAAARLGMVVRAAAGVFGVPCLGSRCTTFRRGASGTNRGCGKEPDDSF